MGQMNIYEVLASGSWMLFRRADWPVWMQVGSKSVPEGEESLTFGLDLKVERTCNGTRQNGNYMIDGRDYQKGAGRIKLGTVGKCREFLNKLIDNVMEFSYI